MPQDSRTHYDVLGITRNAKAVEVERAYRQLRAEMREEAAAPDPRRALRIQTAYEVLSDPARRAHYDESLHAPRDTGSPARRAAWIAGAALTAVVLAVGAWLALRPAAVAPRNPADIAADASLAVGRLQSVGVSGAVTDHGLAFALDEGTLVATCGALAPGAELIVGFAQRKVAARVAADGASVCRLAAHGVGSWPLRLRPGLPAKGEKVYAVRLDAAGQAALVEGIVGAAGMRDGSATIEVKGAAEHAPAGGPLLDTQGRVLGIALGGGRWRSVPAEWLPGARPIPAAR